MKQLKYSTFELLVLIFGAGTIFALVFASPWQTAVETVAQLLLIPVLVSVLYYGRKGGLIAFVLASAVYLMMRAPDILKMGLVAPIRQLLLIRILAYGIVGLGGGLVCSRIKYFFVKSEQVDLLDDVTGVFGVEYLGLTIKKYIAQFERYRHRFCVAVFMIDEKLFAGLGDARIRKELKRIALVMRNDIRAVDECGRLEGTEFCLILPFTDVPGAMVIAERLRKLIVHHLEKRKYCSGDGIKVKVDIFGYPEDEKKVHDLLEKLGVHTMAGSSENVLLTK
jgi:diguanylate cyclase (GGDEF)-like protein